MTQKSTFDHPKPSIFGTKKKNDLRTLRPRLSPAASGARRRPPEGFPRGVRSGSGPGPKTGFFKNVREAFPGLPGAPGGPWGGPGVPPGGTSWEVPPGG